MKLLQVLAAAAAYLPIADASGISTRHACQSEGLSCGPYDGAFWLGWCGGVLCGERGEQGPPSCSALQDPDVAVRGATVRAGHVLSGCRGPGPGSGQAGTELAQLHGAMVRLLRSAGERLAAQPLADADVAHGEGCVAEAVWQVAADQRACLDVRRRARWALQALHGVD